MAHKALDKPNDGKPAATYYGGHELIAQTWRQPWPTGDSPEDRKRRENRLCEVRKACRALIDAGAIRVVETDKMVRSGHAQTYLLTL